MLRVFDVSGENITITGSNTLVFINPPAAPGVSIRILRAWASQHGTATSQQIGIKHVTQVTAFPTLTSATPRPKALHDAASAITGGTAGAAGTCGINASAEGAGTKTTRFSDAFNNLNGYLWVPTPAEVIELSCGSASGYGLVLLTTPTTLTGWDFGVTFQEY